jgi:hypothetical protein
VDLRGEYLVDTLHDHLSSVPPEAAFYGTEDHTLTASQMRADKAWQN